MTFYPGDNVIIDLPGHVFHGKLCLVVKDAVFDGLGRVIFVRGRGVAEPIGFDISHINGTAESNRRRRWEGVLADDGQQELGL